MNIEKSAEAIIMPLSIFHPYPYGGLLLCMSAELYQSE